MREVYGVRRTLATMWQGLPQALEESA
jgi:hypothetical protein